MMRHDVRIVGRIEHTSSVGLEGDMGCYSSFYAAGYQEYGDEIATP